MKPNNPLRTLARSGQIQSLYRNMKDGLPVSFFQNTSDLTALQHEFLMWVKVYSFLLELIQEKHPLLNEKILEHDLWVDAFLLWREKHPDVKPEDLKRRKSVVICR